MCDPFKASEKLDVSEDVFLWFTFSSGFGDRFDPTEILTVMETEVFMLLIFLFATLQWNNNIGTSINRRKGSKMGSGQANQVISGITSYHQLHTKQLKGSTCGLQIKKETKTIPIKFYFSLKNSQFRFCVKMLQFFLISLEDAGNLSLISNTVIPAPIEATWILTQN